MTYTSPFVRLGTGASDRLHVAKDQHPNEAVCGRVLRPDPVTSKGRKKCSHCSDIISKRAD